MVANKPLCSRRLTLPGPDPVDGGAAVWELGSPKMCCEFPARDAVVVVILAWTLARLDGRLLLTPFEVDPLVVAPPVTGGNIVNIEIIKIRLLTYKQVFLLVNVAVCMSNGTLPKPLGLCGSTKVGFISIQALYFEILPQTWGESMHGKGIKMIVSTI